MKTPLLQTKQQIDQLIYSWDKCQGVVSDKTIRKTEIKIQDGSLLLYFREQLYKSKLNITRPKIPPVSSKVTKANVPLRNIRKQKKAKSTKPAVKTPPRFGSLGHCPLCGSKNIDRVTTTGKYKCYSCHKEGFIPVITSKEKELAIAGLLPPVIRTPKKNVAVKKSNTKKKRKTHTNSTSSSKRPWVHIIYTPMGGQNKRY